MQQRVDGGAGGRVSVLGLVRGGERRGVSGQGEVVQGGEDHRGTSLARRADSMARRAYSDSLRAIATRLYSGDVSAATSPKCRYT